MPEWNDGKIDEQIAKPLWRKQVFGTCDVDEKYDELYYQKIEKKGDLLVKVPLTVEQKTRRESFYWNCSHEILFETRGNWLDRRNGYSYGSAIFDSKADLYAYGFNVGGKIKSFSLIYMKPLQEWLKNNRSSCRFNYSATGNDYKTEFVIVRRDTLPAELFFPVELIVPGYRFMTSDEEIQEQLEQIKTRR